MEIQEMLFRKKYEPLQPHYIDGHLVRNQATNYILDTPPSDLTEMKQLAELGRQNIEVIRERLLAERRNEQQNK